MLLGYALASLQATRQICGAICGAWALSGLVPGASAGMGDGGPGCFDSTVISSELTGKQAFPARHLSEPRNWVRKPWSGEKVVKGRRLKTQPRAMETCHRSTDARSHWLNLPRSMFYAGSFLEPPTGTPCSPTQKTLLSCCGRGRFLAFHFIC